MPRPLGNLQVTSTSGRAPMAIVVAYLQGTAAPIAAFVQEGPTADVNSRVLVKGEYVNVEHVMDDIGYEELRPSNGGGIRRRRLDFTIRKVGDNLTTGPFESTYTPTLDNDVNNSFDFIWRQLYTGGISKDSLYFSAYLIDRSKQYEDIAEGFSLGTYKLDVGTSWGESDESTKFTLVDALLVEDNYVGASDEDVDDTIYIFNSWFSENTIPKPFGMVPRIRMLNSFPSISTRELSSSFSGNVPVAYGVGTADIILQDNVENGHPALQLAVLGAKVRVHMETGEVIRGDLFYDSGTEEIILQNVERNVSYAEGDSYTYNADGELPPVWGLGNNPPNNIVYRKIVVRNARRLIQAPNGWAAASITYYDAGQPNFRWTVAGQAFELEGFGDTENSVRHEAINHPSLALNSSSVSHFFDPAQVIQGNPYTATAYYSVMYYKNFYVPIEFYFVDPSIGPVAGSANDAWNIVAIDDLNVTYDCYLQEGFSRYDEDHLYAEGDGGLVKIPTGNIVSVTTGVTAFGMSNLVQVRLDNPPLEMDIGATSNVVYIDCLYKSGPLENRPERILREIILDSGVTVQDKMGLTLTDNASYTTLPWMPWLGYLARANETLTEVIDRLCFQSGASLDWRKGLLELTQTVVPVATFIEDTVSERVLKNTRKLGESRTLLNESATFELGKLETLVETNVDGGSGDVERFEWRAMFYELKFGAWEDPFAPEAKGLSNQTVPKGHYKYSYTFDLINDAPSASYAANLTLTAGHPSSYATVERNFSLDCELSVLEFQVMDRARLADFPYFTQLPVPDGRPTESGGTWNYPLPDSERQFILNGFVVIETISLQMSVKDYSLNVSAKMAQPWCEAVMSWLTGSLITIPAVPPDPSNDPDENPGGGSGVTTGIGYLQQYKEYNIAIDKAPEEIDSDAGLALTVTVTTEDPFDIGFTMQVSVDMTGVSGGPGSHVVSDGDNTGGAIATPVVFTVLPSFLGEHSVRNVVVNFLIEYNDESVSSFSESVAVSLDSAPDIVAS